MTRSRTSLGLVIAVVAALSFGMSGAFVKPLLEAGWSPAAAVTVRALIGGVVLAPVALVQLRGRWNTLWRARWRILAMGLVGVAATQLLYFAAIELIPVNTAILLEYMAPLLLVLWVWARTRRMPRTVVLIGSVVAVAGLVLVVAPRGGVHLNPLGLLLAAVATIGCAIYYVLAARPSEGLPPVAFASSGLLLGSLVLGLVSLTRVVPFTMTFGSVQLFHSAVPWWVPLLVVGVIATAVAYATSIAASEMLGSRLASFVGLLEVIAAAFYAWILLGESLGVLQLVGGVLILVGIGFVRAEKTDDAPLEAVPPVEMSQHSPR
jgi:drug/metabolite transporter (DMT)-like permease